MGLSGEGYMRLIRVAIACLLDVIGAGFFWLGLRFVANKIDRIADLIEYENHEEFRQRLEALQRRG